MSLELDVMMGGEECLKTLPFHERERPEDELLFII
jgi:hypothetical protein